MPSPTAPPYACTPTVPPGGRYGRYGGEIPGRRVSHASHTCTPEMLTSVHTAQVQPDDDIADDKNALKAEVGQNNACVAVRVKNTLAVQFHPEKSQRAGSQLIKSHFRPEHA